MVTKEVRYQIIGRGSNKSWPHQWPLERRFGDWEGAWEARGIAPIHPWPGCWWSILSGILYKALEWVYPITNFLARGSSWLVLRAQNKFGSALHFHFGQVGVLTPDKDFLLLPANKRLRNMSTSGNGGIHTWKPLRLYFHVSFWNQKIPAREIQVAMEERGQGTPTWERSSEQKGVWALWSWTS